MAIQNYQYDPIQPPQDMLEQKVGTPDRPMPPMDPAKMAASNYPNLPATTGLMGTAAGPAKPPPPSYQQEDADIVGQLNRITSRNNPYMQQARSAGLQVANKRGLLNSSMAAGASQAAALERAGPLAQANATNINARNLQRMENESRAYELGETLGSQERVAGLEQSGLMERLKIAESGMAERLGRQLTSEEKRALEENELKREVTGLEIGSREKIAGQAEAAAMERAKLAEAAASERLGRQLTQSEIESIRTTETQKAMQEFEYAERAKLLETELGSRQSIAEQERAGALERAQLGEAGATERANLAAASAVRDRELANLSEEKRASLQYYMQQNTNFASFLTNIYNNKDMPAPARDAAISYMVSVMNAGSDVPAGIYGVAMDWPGGTPAGATPPEGLIGGTPAEPVAQPPPLTPESPGYTPPPPAAETPTAPAAPPPPGYPPNSIPYTGQDLEARAVTENGQRIYAYYDKATGQRVYGV